MSKLNDHRSCSRLHGRSDSKPGGDISAFLIIAKIKHSKLAISGLYQGQVTSSGVLWAGSTRAKSLAAVPRQALGRVPCFSFQLSTRCNRGVVIALHDCAQ